MACLARLFNEEARRVKNESGSDLMIVWGRTEGRYLVRCWRFNVGAVCV